MIKAESRDQSEEHMERVINWCLLISGLVYLVFAVSSCLAYGQSIQANILQNCKNIRYSSPNCLVGNGTASVVAKWLFVVLAITSYPLMIAPARSIISSSYPQITFENSSLLILIFTLLVSMLSTNLNTVSPSQNNTLFTF